ncbi:MAG: L,D-transpeptidase [Cyanobacteria bacterium J06632_3]
MRKQPPIVRCFIALCFGSAVTLVALEWRNPFPEAVVTPSSLATVGRGNILIESAEAEASNQSRFGIDRWFRSRAARAKVPSESPVQLVLSLSDRTLDVVAAGKPTIRYEVAVGQDDWQTPTGRFTVMNMLKAPAWQHPITKEEIPAGPDNPLGTHWIGFWTDGQAQIGFHGTNQEELIGEAVSHGCIRMRNRDIRDLYKRVDIGTVVTVAE